jgi:hypothetical protein
MNKVLFNSKEEHWSWVWKNYISLYGMFDEEGNYKEASIWEEEDLPRLQPFFEWNKQRDGAGNMPPEVRESFDFYMTKQEAAGEKRERKDVCSAIMQEKLIETLGFIPPETDVEEEEDEDYSITYLSDPNITADTVLELNENYEISYPCIMVYWLETMWDRVGKGGVACAQFVSLKEFNQ